jgi:hypothetical protein
MYVQMLPILNWHMVVVCIVFFKKTKKHVVLINRKIFTKGIARAFVAKGGDVIQEESNDLIREFGALKVCRLQRLRFYINIIVIDLLTTSVGE